MQFGSEGKRDSITSPPPFEFDPLDFEVSRAPFVKSNLYVGGLPSDFTTESLMSLFNPFGLIIRCKVGINNRTGKTAGYGFVQYDNEESATRAILSLNGMQIQDKKLHVSIALGRAKRGPRPKTNLYFSGLPISFETKDLTKMCESFGRIIGSRVLVNPVTNLSRGYGFVRFDTHENALRAIAALNGTILPNGAEPLVVKFAREPSDPEHPSQRRLQKGIDSSIRGSEPGADAIGKRSAVWLMSVPGTEQQTHQRVQREPRKPRPSGLYHAPTGYSSQFPPMRYPRAPHSMPGGAGLVPLYSIPPRVPQQQFTHTSYSLSGHFSSLTIDPSSTPGLNTMPPLKPPDPSSASGSTPPSGTESSPSQLTPTPSPKRGPNLNAIFISGLNPAIEKEALSLLFGSCGKVLEVHIFPPQNGIGSAVIQFDHETSAQRAIDSLQKTKPTEAVEPMAIRIATDIETAQLSTKSVTGDDPPPRVLSAKLPDPVDPGQSALQSYVYPFYAYYNYPYSYTYTTPGSSPYPLVSTAQSVSTQRESSTSSASSLVPAQMSTTSTPYRSYIGTLYQGRLDPYSFQTLTAPMYASVSSSISSPISGEGYYAVATTSASSPAYFGGASPGSQYYYSPEGRLFVRPPR